MFVPAPRLLVLALAGTIPIVLSGSRAAAISLAVLWILGALLAGFVDARFAPPARDMVWTRELDPKLSLGVWNRAVLQLTNRSSRAVTFRVRDAAPDSFVATSDSARGECGPRAAWSQTAYVFPTERGAYRFDRLAVRYLGPLGLAWRTRKEPVVHDVKVYPNLIALRSYDALVRSGQLQQLGLRVTRRRGAGTEFERLRDYTPDDEYRRIAWKATARRGTPVVIDYQVERSQNVVIVLDVGRLMSTRVRFSDAEVIEQGEYRSAPEARPLTRLDYALNTSLLMAYVGQAYGDRVGLLAFSDRIDRFLPPRPGRRQFFALLDLLYDLRPEATEADYRAGLGFLASRVTRRSLVIIFTDVGDGDSADELVRQVAHLRPRHLPLVVTLRDPAVQTLASQLPADTAGVYQRSVAADLLARREETLTRLRQRGVMTIDVAADALSPALISRYLEIKARALL